MFALEISMTNKLAAAEGWIAHGIQPQVVWMRYWEHLSRLTNNRRTLKKADKDVSEWMELKRAVENSSLNDKLLHSEVKPWLLWVIRWNECAMNVNGSQATILVNAVLYPASRNCRILLLLILLSANASNIDLIGILGVFSLPAY